MRTTLNLTDEALRLAKARAATLHQSLGEVVSAAVLDALRTRPKSAQTPRVALPVCKAGGGLRSGIDLDDWSSVEGALDKEKFQDRAG